MQESTYLAHISEDRRAQTIYAHLQGTAVLCAQFAAPFGAAEQGALAGWAHDIGKYSDAFQRRLNGSPERTDHSTAGAYECALLGQTAAAFCVAGHHGGLPDLGGRGDTEDQPTLMGRFKRGENGALSPYGKWKEEVSLPPAGAPDFLGRDPLTDAFFVRMLYSCLVDADFLDTERFMSGHEPDRGVDTELSELNRRLGRYIAPWFPPKGELNTRRCEILTHCMEGGAQHAPGLFTLTVPTGGGKTVASLAFALRHALAHQKRRVIYVIPYTSIIEQTAEVFREILGPEHVLEHHSGVQYDLTEEASPESMRMARATENWDMPVIVTTAVQFFESLYANRSSKCRKLHNLADSVIIFDEAQMMPIPYLRPCVHTIAQLVSHYGVSAVLCTATQPALAPIFREFLPGYLHTELCPEPLFRDPIFRRVHFRQAGTLSWTDLASALEQHPQVLCIVNNRKSAQTVYRLLDPEGAFHLSTLMCPAHRKAALAEIRRRLREGLPCRVVSTSLIEAGVDVDFPAVFREQAGLDSILQAAGRCNREGKRPAQDSIVTIFRSTAKPSPLFSASIDAGQTAMETYDDIAGREAIQCYFQELLALKGTAAQDRNNVIPAFARGDFPFRTVAERFHLIDSDTRTLYIPLDEAAELIQMLRLGKRSRSLFRRLGQYSVSIYENHYQDLESAGALEVLEDGSAILCDSALYSAETGLSLDADSGRALFI